MLTENRAKYAKELKIDIPSLLFKGVLGASTLFESGILSDKLKSEFNLRKNTMHWNNQELLVQDIKSLFLFLESKYGGAAEGIVASYNDKIIKFQQSFQTDQLHRAKIKSAFTDNDAEIEANYWKNVRGASFGIVSTIKVTSKIEDMLKELSLIMKKIPVTFTHSKKTEAQIKDDIQGNAKTLILKKMKGNNNCLYFGKFRVLTRAHYDIIKKGQRLFDDIVVDLITSKDTADTKDLRKEMLLAAFPNLIIIENNTGNISNLLNKTPKNINAILAGSDRVRDYQNQINSQLGLYIKEIPRTSDDISATKVIQNIGDESYFQKNTPKEIWRLYDKIKKEYKSVSNGV
jgi:phosphopantetheine adenylyltransferase